MLLPTGMTSLAGQAGIMVIAAQRIAAVAVIVAGIAVCEAGADVAVAGSVVCAADVSVYCC